MNKSIAKKLHITFSLVVVSALLFATLPTKIFAASTGSFDPATDGLVKDFVNYQTFGGKYGTATKSVTYNVFIPTGFSFDPSTERLQMVYTGGGNPAYPVADDTAYKNVCPEVSGGHNCTVTWTFDETKLAAGEYTLLFKVLDNTTHQKGRIFAPLSLGTGSTPSYLLTGGSTDIFLNKPIATPYAEFQDIPAINTLADKQAAQSFPVKVRLNKQNNPTSVSYYLDGVLAGTASTATTVADNSFTGGQTSVFTFTFTNLASLANGSHLITAKANGNGYSVPVVTPDGQAKITVVAAFTNDPACLDKIKAMGEVTLSVINNETGQLHSIEIIDTKVRQYFADHPSQLASYSDLIKISDAANGQAYASLANLVKANNFQCDNLSTGIDGFLSQMDTVYQSLTTYRDAVINFIDELGGTSQ